MSLGAALPALRAIARTAAPFFKHVGADDCANENGGAEMVFVLPGRISISDGQHHLKALRMTPKGALRWYAGCCGRPMGNMLPVNKIRLSNLPLSAFEGASAAAQLGPLIGSLNSADAPEEASPPQDFGRGRVTRRVAFQNVLASLGLAPRANLYFDPQGKPAVPVHKLTDAERAAAYS